MKGVALHRRTLAELASGLRAREFSSVELTQALLARVNASQAKLNAFITITESEALAAAAAADAQIAAGRAGWLTGIPLAHKDIFCTNGVLIRMLS